MAFEPVNTMVLIVTNLGQVGEDPPGTFELGTGVMIDNNIVATCAHLFYDSSRDATATEVEVYANAFFVRNGSNIQITGVPLAVSNFLFNPITSSGGIENAANAAQDFGAILLSADAGLGYLSLMQDDLFAPDGTATG
jgi:hypothetical protein